MAETNKKTKMGKGFGVTALVCGICALVFLWIPYFNIILAIIALVFGIIALAKKADGTGLAVAGVVTGGLGFIIGTLYVIFVTWAIGTAVNIIENANETTWNELTDWSERVNTCISNKGLDNIDEEDMTAEQLDEYLDCFYQ